MFNKTKKIIDERQELQSLKNAKICWITMILLLAVSISVQSTVYSLDMVYFMPECIILIFTCFLNLLLDIRQGNLFTKDTANPKLNILLYVSFSLLFAVFLGVGNYLKWHFPIGMIALVVIPSFIVMLSLMLLADYVFKIAAKRRMKTLENQMLSTTDLEEPKDL